MQQSESDSKLPQEFTKELLPTLKEYLSVAKDHGMTIIFDLSEPNPAHPYHDGYINASLNAVLSSGISHSKVCVCVCVCVCVLVVCGCMKSGETVVGK